MYSSAHLQMDSDYSFDQQLQWALSPSKNGKEHVNMPSFAKKFNCTDAESAKERYLRLIKSSKIVHTRREYLAREYKIFEANEAQQYWESLQFKISLRSTARKAAVSSAEAGLHELEAEYSTYKEGSADQSSKYTSSGLAMPSGSASTYASSSSSITLIGAAGQTHSRDSIGEQAPSRHTLSIQIPPTSRLFSFVNKERVQETDGASTGTPLPATPFSETTSTSTSTSTSPTSPTAPAPSSPSKRKKSFTKKNRRSLEGRYNALGEKWILTSGTIVEDVLYTAGSDEDCESFSPIHSFMLDLDDAKTKALFSEEDWKEIISDLPPYENYGKEAGEYLDKCMEVVSRKDMRKILEERQDDPECKIIYYCMDQWEELLSSESSPFLVAAQLGETWWNENAWGVCRRLTTGVKDAFIILGEKTCHDSSDRRNQDIGTNDGKEIGVKADLLWRTISCPYIDWSVGESATFWDPASMEYRNESGFKLPRQLHDILVARTSEVSGVDSLRQEYVCGLLIRGPVIQRVQICWGTKGVNITRFFRSPERRLFPAVQELGTSLMAVHDLLTLRATTLRLCHKYQESRRKLSKASAMARHQELLLPSVSPRDIKRKFGLLSSSP